MWASCPTWRSTLKPVRRSSLSYAGHNGISHHPVRSSATARYCTNTSTHIFLLCLPPPRDPKSVVRSTSLILSRGRSFTRLLCMLRRRDGVTLGYLSWRTGLCTIVGTMAMREAWGMGGDSPAWNSTRVLPDFKKKSDELSGLNAQRANFTAVLGISIGHQGDDYYEHQVWFFTEGSRRCVSR